MESKQSEGKASDEDRNLIDSIVKHIFESCDIKHTFLSKSVNGFILDVLVSYKVESQEIVAFENRLRNVGFIVLSMNIYPNKCIHLDFTLMKVNALKEKEQ